jgi:hypothetical protein
MRAHHRLGVGVSNSSLKFVTRTVCKHFVAVKEILRAISIVREQELDGGIPPTPNQALEGALDDLIARLCRRGQTEALRSVERLPPSVRPLTAMRSRGG